MTSLILLVVAALGAAVGLLGKLLLRESCPTPQWIMVMTGATAAVLGTAAARTVSTNPSGPIPELFAAVLFGAVAVAATFSRVRARRRRSSPERQP